MAFSRRQFVGLGGVFVASAIAPLEAAASHNVLGAASFDASLEVPLQYMDRNTFTRLIGTRFTVHTRTSRTVPLILTAVEELKTAGPQSAFHRGAAPRMVGKVPPPSTQRTSAFALRFRGPAGKILTQDSYVFESGSLGKIALFIVPGSKSMRVPTYTAIINHLQ